MKNKRIITLCKCCGTPILDRTAQARYHIDREPCYSAQQAHTLDQERRCREHQLDERRDLRPDKRRATGPKCPHCKKNRLPPGYRYRCPDCWSREHSITEGNYVYASYGVDEMENESRGGAA